MCIRDRYDAQQVPAEAKDELLEYAGIATVADVMELQGKTVFW